MAAKQKFHSISAPIAQDFVDVVLPVEALEWAYDVAVRRTDYNLSQNYKHNPGYQVGAKTGAMDLSRNATIKFTFWANCIEWAAAWWLGEVRPVDWESRLKSFAVLSNSDRKDLFGKPWSADVHLHGSDRVQYVEVKQTVGSRSHRGAIPKDGGVIELKDIHDSPLVGIMGQVDMRSEQPKGDPLRSLDSGRHVKLCGWFWITEQLWAGADGGSNPEQRRVPWGDVRPMEWLPTAVWGFGHAQVGMAGMARAENAGRDALKQFGDLAA